MKIGRTRIGAAHRPYVIAEIGINHNGDARVAVEMVRAAAAAGSDAVKLQAFTASKLVAPGRAGRLAHVEDDAKELFERLELGASDFHLVRDACREAGVAFIVTPFDEDSADMLHEIGVDAFKIASGDITHIPLLKHVASKGRPVILSTGASNLAEIDAAVRTIRRAAKVPLALLHCVSRYPAQADEMNLRAIETMSRRYGVPVGLSDHTLGIAVSIAAAALGASIIEKHFTTSRRLPGPDQGLSVEPAELRDLIQGARIAWEARGDGKKVPSRGESGARRQARRGLHVVREMARGEKIRPTDVAALRPACGIAPAQLGRIIGRRTRRRLPAWSPLEAKDLA